MKTNYALLALAAVIALPFSATCEEDVPVSVDKIKFAEAQKIATANDHNAAAMQYNQDKFFPYFKTTYAPVVKDCRDQIKAASYEGFIALLTLDQAGKVKEIALSKKTPLGDCILKKLTKDTFAPPPFTPFVQRVVMHFK